MIFSKESCNMVLFVLRDHTFEQLLLKILLRINAYSAFDILLPRYRARSSFSSFYIRYYLLLMVLFPYYDITLNKTLNVIWYSIKELNNRCIDTELYFVGNRSRFIASLA